MSVHDKPLPVPPSPTLTNPDMVLPTMFVLDAADEARQETSGPPSPSYLQAQTTKTLGNKRKSRPNLGGACSQSPVQSFGSSPTLHIDKQSWDDERRLSYAASSILTEDLDKMQMPRFESSLDSDTETLDEDDFDIDTPSDMESDHVLQTEQPNVTLMRAELILANAKKRLNLMDQNLRGARDMVTPLTAANLRRATSLTTGPVVPNTSFSRPRYLPHNPQSPNTQHMRVLSDSNLQPDDRRYMSLNINSTPSWTTNPVRNSRSSELLRYPRSPLSPDPQLGTVSEEQSVRSQTLTHNPREQTLTHTTREQTSTHNLREQMMQLRGRISTLKERAQEENLRRRSTNNLRDTCPLNNADTSPRATGSPRPRLARITKASHVPGAWVSAETIDDNDRQDYRPREEELDEEEEEDDDDDNYTLPHSGSGSTDRTSTPTTTTTDHSNPTSLYQDASENVSGPRHEDRDDAFDYSNFFLHSATGTFEPNTPTRHARTTSLSSSDSCLTARAYPVTAAEELRPPPTPETPEALRHIEQVTLPSRIHHRRGLSAESLATIATFETAEEGHQASIAQWLSRSTSATSTHNLNHAPKSTRGHPSTQAALPSPVLPSTYTPASAQQAQHYISISPSATTIAVSALLDSTDGQGLGSKDEALVYTLVESLRELVGELQLGAGGEEKRRWLRRRLDEARRVLEGEHLER